MFYDSSIIFTKQLYLYLFSLLVYLLPSMRDCSIKVFHFHIVLIVLLEYFKVTTTNFMTILLEYDLTMYKSTKSVAL